MMNIFLPRLLLLHSLCFSTFAFGAARLPQDEVQALTDIAKTLGKTGWDFSVDPCSGQLPWTNISALKGFESAVTCNCSFDDSTVCHVTSIILKTQDLPGTLPREMVRLKYLQEIDLTRNYLNGNIPPEWSSLQLVNISLAGNRLTGPIPVEFINITTLKSLDLSSNSLSGALPEGLGNFSSMERMILSSNKFTGYLPDTFENLTTLKDFRISDSNFSGEIPYFIGFWTNLEKLVMQGSGLTGPIPSTIFQLTKLIDMRITDLNRPEFQLPSDSNMTRMETLMLRSCYLIGEIPSYFSDMKGLKILDLSFNKLGGEIPYIFMFLGSMEYMRLTGNMLNGEVPDRLPGNVDLSDNNLNFSSEICEPKNHSSLFVSSSNNKGTGQYSSLHINCGGKEVTVKEDKNATYEDDTNPAGASIFYQRKSNWALRSTGYSDDRSADTFILTNKTRLSMKNPELYMNARVSPSDLTYYGFCLEDGVYSVNLHFAEIMFRNDKTYESLGRRVFDIYIQDNLVRKDFNIMAEAGGVGRVVIITVQVYVDGTLKIHFRWAGKGPTGIPLTGVYGPLISAISAEHDDRSPVSESGIYVPAVLGIVAGGIFIILLVFGIIWKRDLMGQPKTLEDDLKSVDLQTGRFSFKQLKAATANFDKANKIGEGGFGSVYKGILADGTIIAVKQLSSTSKQGNREFVNEIGMISAVQHPHLVSLYGCCIEGNQLLLVYEYMENNSVARALFGAKESHLKLDWPTRHKICIGLARGLAYLHEESRLKVVHRDIKATNVLLDKNLNPKISDFGLAKLNEEDNTHISTRIAGTLGYMAPEYAMRGYLTDKADVYSFGIVLLEIVSGRNNTSYRTKAECFYLLDWATLLKAQGNLMDIVDPRLGSDFNKEEMMVTINVALLCTNATSAVRPTMSSVVSMLEGRVAVQELVLDPNPSSNEIDAMRNHFQSYLEGSAGESQIQTESIEEARTISYASGHDLYPISPDSNY
ncbi:unnamed protein product [Malus baccata var. baccata]